MTNVEVICRLIEDQEAWLLREGAGHHHTLSLSSGHCAEMSVGHTAQVQTIERCVDNSGIVSADPTGKPTTVRRASQRHNVSHRQSEVCRLFLKHSRNLSGNGAGGLRPDVLAIDRHGSSHRPMISVEKPQKCGLAGAVRSDNAKNPPGSKSKADRVQEGLPCPAHGPADVLYRKRCSGFHGSVPGMRRMSGGVFHGGVCPCGSGVTRSDTVLSGGTRPRIPVCNGAGRSSRRRNPSGACR